MERSISKLQFGKARLASRKIEFFLVEGVSRGNAPINRVIPQKYFIKKCSENVPEMVQL
jgi:hypothetical protein